MIDLSLPQGTACPRCGGVDGCTIAVPQHEKDVYYCAFCGAFMPCSSHKCGPQEPKTSHCWVCDTVYNGGIHDCTGKGGAYVIKYYDFRNKPIKSGTE